MVHKQKEISKNFRLNNNNAVRRSRARFNLSENDRLGAAEKIRRGERLIDVASFYRITYDQLRGDMKKMNVQAKRGRRIIINEKILEKAAPRVGEGESLSSVGRDLGVDISELGKKLKKEKGITSRYPGISKPKPH